MRIMIELVVRTCERMENNMATYQRQRYLTPNGFYEASKAFGMTISKQKIYEYLDTGMLRGYRVGSHWRVPVEELNDLEERLLSEAAGKPTVHTGMLGNKVTTLNG